MDKGFVPNAFLLVKRESVLIFSTIFVLSSFHGLIVWGWGLLSDGVLFSPSPSLPTLF